MDTTKIKKGLGRGLSSLIGETKADVNINKVSISNLQRNKLQPRKLFEEDRIDVEPIWYDEINIDDVRDWLELRGINPLIEEEWEEQKSISTEC